MTAVRLHSPVAGVVRPLADVPDVVFAEAVVGPGIAVEPDRTGRQDVLAPCDGVVGALHPHAFALELADGRSVLVHAGIDTVRLAGLGFELHVQRGEAVRTGQRMLSWSPVDVAAAGLATICPVVAVQADDAVLVPLAPEGEHVAAGAPLLDWQD
ncbi:PTS sugar transporter subunit IIA [Cellulomonas oligotrophica]|uniref:PTS glucose transporter subunit IIA n=1 Tax=Cellulomonas oligotrophica TaxID=931536 RepID=A0A7Y9FIW1_9CELL|nr:PTS glucose transporter subunit IIA [Cellulomonas oligotrophica]NYD87958.1 PTS system glucose-specific IIA component/PTS system N-acetylglucosamine-specific IIA component [Cellulomonas oligotrophica]GIG32834.1 PTS glucose transporter subunit IIA [Cellulomonas oligotrophica]